MFGWLRNMVSAVSGSWNFNTGKAYKAARITPNTACWQPPHRSGESAIRDSWSGVTARVRDLVKNNANLKKARNQLRDLTIGPGIATYADAMLPDGSSLDDFNTQSDTWWERWCELECDWDREKSFEQMLALSFQEMSEVGNCFWWQRYNRDNDIVPLCYKLIEWEQVNREFDVPGDEFGRGRVQNGIEYDMQGRKKFLYVYTQHPYDDLQGNGGDRWVKIPFTQLIHNFIPSQISSQSGISWFTTMVLSAKDVDWYLENELTAAAISALLTLVVKRENPGGTSGSGCHPLDAQCGTGASGGSDVVMGQAVTAEVGVNEDVKIAESSRPNRDASDFIHLMQTEMAMGAGMSVNRLTGDPSRSNYAAIRASHEDDNAMVRPLQNHQITKVIKPIRKKFTGQAVAMRRIVAVTAREYERNRYRYDTVSAIPPARASLDDRVETEASISRLRAFITTPQIECARYGRHWKRNLRDHAAWIAECNSLGLASDWSKGQGGQLEKPSSEAVEPEEETADVD